MAGNDTHTLVENAGSEEQLVEIAKNALSSCNWVIGQCAEQWTSRYSKGRTDADFGQMVGMSGDQIYQRRRVWEKFSEVRNNYESLSWSHFYVALNWEDAEECLNWATDNTATVAVMRAWRRSNHGEDLTTPSEQMDHIGYDVVTDQPVPVRDPSEFGQPAGFVSGGAGEWSPGNEQAPFDPELVMSGAPQRLDPTEEPYAPFGANARGPAFAEGGTATKPRVEQTPEMIAKKMTSAVERCCRQMSGDQLQYFQQDPEMCERFLDALDDLHEWANRLR